MDSNNKIDQSATILELENQITLLKKKIADDKSKEEEWAQFHQMFPEIKRNSIPSHVLKCAQDGMPIYAAYAVHAHIVAQERQRAQLAQEENHRKSTGNVGRESLGEREFTSDEIRRMSPPEVKRNYVLIIRSLTKR